MAVWQVTKQGKPTGAFVDDELLLIPGEEGFDDSEAITLAEEAGGDGVSYVGPSAKPQP